MWGLSRAVGASLQSSPLLTFSSFRSSRPSTATPNKHPDQSRQSKAASPQAAHRFLSCLLGCLGGAQLATKPLWIACIRLAVCRCFRPKETRPSVRPRPPFTFVDLFTYVVYIVILGVYFCICRLFGVVRIYLGFLTLRGGGVVMWCRTASPFCAFVYWSFLSRGSGCAGNPC